MSNADVSVDYGRGPLLQEVSVAVLAMSLRDVRGNAQRIQTLIESVEHITKVFVDPNLANHIDISR